MNGGGGDHTPLTSPAADGSEFLLQLLRRSPHQPPPQPNRASSSTQSENLSLDPAVAAVGPSLPFSQLPSNGHEISQHPPPWSYSPPFAPHNFFIQGFPRNPHSSPSHTWSPSATPPRQNLLPNYGRLDDERKLGFPGSSHRPELGYQHEKSIVFGTFRSEIQNNEGIENGTSAAAARFDGLLSKQRENYEGNWRFNGLESNFQNPLHSSRNPPGSALDFWNSEQGGRTGFQGIQGRLQHPEGFRGGASSSEVRRPPPGFQNKPSNFGQWEPGNRSLDRNVNISEKSYGELEHRDITLNNGNEGANRLFPEHRKMHGDTASECRLRSQLESPGPPAGSNLLSVSASDFEDSSTKLHDKTGGNGGKLRLQDNGPKGSGPIRSELDDLAGHMEDSLVLEDGSGQKSDGKQRQHRDKVNFFPNSYKKGKLCICLVCIKVTGGRFTVLQRCCGYQIIQSFIA